ncbi:MAG: hypothetical protein MUC92_04355 [Fimbriimonadaceae bacterium]|jgi:PBP1b-binding outer membrane lipoprotein LpoB|nr:hypothetical protein [Fimbriimonadaceae bacterium]
MKWLAAFLLLLTLLVAGCSSGTATDAEIKSAADELNKASAGVEPIPDPDVVQRGGATPGAGAAPKPGK